VGGPDLDEINETISRAGIELRRAIYITSFTVREFRERIEVKEEHVLEALEGPRIMLNGHEEELIGLSEENCWRVNAS
jgi:hypothetical protein